jgi:hypothetical protein
VSPVQLTIVGKPDCHLCDVAEAVVHTVVTDLDGTASVVVSKRSILEDAELHARYWEQIPVILVNGVEHSHWHVDPDALRVAILEG